MSTSIRPTKAFWIVAWIFLLWNAFGCFMYMLDKLASDETMLAMENGAALLEAREAYPLWATAAYAVAVWGGLLAAFLLLLRKQRAIPLFVLSLVTAAICFIPTFTMPAVQGAGGETYWMMPVIVIVLGLIEIIFARRMRAKGVIG